MGARKYLPIRTAEEDLTLIQARVDKSLADKVNKRRQELGVTWNELQEAMIKSFLEETEKEKKS